MRAKVSRSEEGFIVSLSDGRNCYFVEEATLFEVKRLQSGGILFFCPGICDLGFIKTQIEYLAGEEKVKFFF